MLLTEVLHYNCTIYNLLIVWYSLDGRAVNTCASCTGGLEFKTWTAKSCTVLQTVHHRFNIYAGSCVALALCHGDGHRKLVTPFAVIQRVL